MKSFFTIQDVFGYCPKCPICNEPLYNLGKDTFEIKLSSTESIMVYKDNSCKFYFSVENKNYSHFGFDLNNPKFDNDPNYTFSLIGNQFIYKFAPRCRSTSKKHYGMLFELSFNYEPNNSYFIKADLLKEHFFINESHFGYEVVNDYRDNQTRFYHDLNKIEMPLISDNLFEPHAILNRLKKLIIFF